MIRGKQATVLKAVGAVGLYLFLAAFADAGKGPKYGYGDVWWQEYRSDAATSLLLHFGPETAPAYELVRQRIVDTRAEERQDELLTDDLDGGDEPLQVGSVKALSVDDLTIGPVDESTLKPGEVADYSEQRARIKLPKGYRVVDEGRFGGGLDCQGADSLVIEGVPISRTGVVECWFRVAKLPTAPSCLLATTNDEARLLLRPDGRVELKLSKPWGLPGDKENRGVKANYQPEPEQLAEVQRRDAEIVSPNPIARNEWVHVAFYNRAHPTPGGGEPFDARLVVNGTDVDGYLSGRYNDYNFLGRHVLRLTVGNNATGEQPFVGTIDELRVSSRNRSLIERPALPWDRADFSRPLDFNKPFFRADSTVFHLSFEDRLALAINEGNANDAQVDLKGQKLSDLQLPGVRGKALVADQVIGLPKVELRGLSAANGALEFWFRPLNWDDVTGYWQHSPPKQKRLSVARLYGVDARSGTQKVFAQVFFDRAFNLERKRVPVDPGHWLHVLVVWRDDSERGIGYINGRRGGRVTVAPVADRLHMKPSHAEFGVADEVAVRHGEAPLAVFDEIIGHRTRLDAQEAVQAYHRVQRALAPIRLYEDELKFKWSLQKLTYRYRALPSESMRPARYEISLHDMARNGALVGERRTGALAENSVLVVLRDGEKLPHSTYEIRHRVFDPADKVIIEGKRVWDYQEEPWRHNRAGVLDYVPEPWSPVMARDGAISTCMTRYRLAANGLPESISADGEELLAAPVRLLENGNVLTGKPYAMGAGTDLGTSWRMRFDGVGARIDVDCAVEYDGMLKFTMAVEPTADTLAPLAFEIPLRGELAKRVLWHNVGARGVSARAAKASDGFILRSRFDPQPAGMWRTWKRSQKQHKLSWQDYKAAHPDMFVRYNFYTHLSINDMNRGLWWFCDNAAGWWQSQKTSAITLERRGEQAILRLNLIAEAVASERYRELTASQRTPIVFALLPHPARPMVTKYRLFERVLPEVDNKASTIFDTFRPWPANPRDHDMKLYPAADPKQPDAGPSWAYAESCIPRMKSTMPHGTRTLYLSKAWFSCRAGAYDNWEWRSGDSSTVSLTPSFVNYLCWEMNEWIGRGIWDAVYLDECYEHAARNLEAGFSVRLPDGKEQPGVTNFQFRELMKRWRNIFHAHKVEPVMMAHHTYSWQYHGILYCDAYLDGENAPIVSLKSRDWIDSTHKARYEVIQNGRLWGLSSFYMPFIAEGGFHDKEKSQFQKWQWRTARQAQSQFAHYETATVYEGQGAQIYRGYWRELLVWGVGDPSRVTFHPYWAAAGVKVDDQGGDSLVSYYYDKIGKRMLLIASNRQKAPKTLQVALDLPQLGLPAQPRLRSLDGTLGAPPGDDHVKDEDQQGDPQQNTSVDAVLDDDGGHLDVELDDPDVVAKEALVPRMEGNVLYVPVRGRDYRVVEIR